MTSNESALDIKIWFICGITTTRMAVVDLFVCTTFEALFINLPLIFFFSLFCTAENWCEFLIICLFLFGRSNRSRPKTRQLFMSSRSSSIYLYWAIHWIAMDRTKQQQQQNFPNGKFHLFISTGVVVEVSHFVEDDRGGFLFWPNGVFPSIKMCD